MGKGDMIKDFKFQRQDVKPKFLPSLKYKIIFLALASSGLRISELLNATIDTDKRMLLPELMMVVRKNHRSYFTMKKQKT